MTRRRIAAVLSQLDRWTDDRPVPRRFSLDGLWRSAMKCHHSTAIEPKAAQTPGCAECLKTGGSWVHLRLCLSCGHVGCCDSSPGRHATRHFQHTHHPVMASFEPDERWAWCYVDQVELELPEDALPYVR